MYDVYIHVNVTINRSRIKTSISFHFSQTHQIIKYQPCTIMCWYGWYISIAGGDVWARHSGATRMKIANKRWNYNLSFQIEKFQLPGWLKQLRIEWSHYQVHMYVSICMYVSLYHIPKGKFNRVVQKSRISPIFQKCSNLFRPKFHPQNSCFRNHPSLN